MGNGGSREVHHHHHTTTTVYEIPPETKKILEEQTDKLEEYKQEAINLGDPTLYKKNSENLINTFVEKLPTLKLTDVINKKTGETHIGFIGQISSGKTSMINALFGKQLPVALGNCTTTCEVVHTQGLNVIWDVPGQNSDFEFYNPINLSFLKDLDKIAILLDNDVSMITNILRVVYKINSNIVIIRTKVDQHNIFNARTLEEEKLLDKKNVKDVLGIDIDTFCVSSHNIIANKGDVFDWIVVKQQLGL